MKKVAILIFAFALTRVAAFACEVCKKNQPEILQDVTHGPGPQGQWDYIIIWTAVVIVAITLFLSIKLLIRPKEAGPDHIKNIVLQTNKSYL